MIDKKTIYFYGNWKTQSGYIGEPQRTLQALIDNYKKKGIAAEVLDRIDKIEKTEKHSIKILIFGDFTTILIRAILCFLSGIIFSNIRIIVFKNKATFRDIFFFLKNINSFNKIKYIIGFSLIEIFLPQNLYNYLLKIFKKKIFIVFFPTHIVERSKIFLCRCLEKKYAQNILFQKDKKFYKNKITLVYFGQDSYLRGVDTINELNGHYKGYNIFSTGFFPFKGYLGKKGFGLQNLMFYNDKNVLEKVKKATFSIFPFRTKHGGPDVPAALIESFFLGVPPIISKVLLFDVLRNHNYPLVIDTISSESIKKCIEENIRNGKDYEKIMSICFSIRQEIIDKYSYNFPKSYA
ncbi:MAG: hypothetical protein HYT07_02520 [Candidatus Levybacteria bacterium]|nr:hypothetical protein [Candidatus Levybacteria bacterium]